MFSKKNVNISKQKYTSRQMHCIIRRISCVIILVGIITILVSLNNKYGCEPHEPVTKTQCK